MITVIKISVIFPSSNMILQNCSCQQMFLHYKIFYKHFNPLTTEDAFWCHQILAACYQLVQSVLKIGFVLAERVRQGEVGGSTALPAAGCRKAFVKDGSVP